MKNSLNVNEKEYKCLECERIFYSKLSLSMHIVAGHKMQLKKYYDKWVKEEGEGICKICGKETKFFSFSNVPKSSYRLTCSKECLKIYFKQQCLEKYGVEHHLQSKKIRNKIKETNLKKYGVECLLQSKEIKDKIKKTNLKKYGVENVYQSKEIKDKIKETLIKKYGVDNPNKNKQIQDKIKKTCQEKYGVDYALQSKEIRKKGKITIKKIYGVDHQSQNEKIHYKQITSGKIMKKFKDTDLYYQGTFELDFLEKYRNQFPDIKRGPTIKYLFENKNKVYYSDFFIPSLNLIVEIKNSYLAKKNKNALKSKENACKYQGFNYIMIIDKEYSEFERLTNS